jgi:MraZ protein
MAFTDFAGTYQCTLDNKNRVNIPSGIRKMFLPQAEDTIVFTKGFEDINLYAYPLDEWQRLTKKLRTLNPFDKKTRDFIRLFMGSAHISQMDSQGRIKLPERILKIAGIEKELLIIGSLSKLEVWSPDRYDAYIEAENLSLPELSEKISFTDMFFDEGA